MGAGAGAGSGSGSKPSAAVRKVATPPSSAFVTASDNGSAGAISQSQMAVILTYLKTMAVAVENISKDSASLVRIIKKSTTSGVVGAMTRTLLEAEVNNLEQAHSSGDEDEDNEVVEGKAAKGEKVTTLCDSFFAHGYRWLVAEAQA